MEAIYVSLFRGGSADGSGNRKTAINPARKNGVCVTMFSV